jgi:hypothetical protein
MPRNSKKPGQATAAAVQSGPARTARLVLGVLLALNVIGAGFLLYPPGGSAEGLQQELISLQTQVTSARLRLERSRTQANSVEKGRSEADEFLKAYFVPLREYPSTLLSEFNDIATRARIRDKGSSYTIAKIEGSDNLNMLTITVNFEGTYRNLLDFVRFVDRSENFWIIESHGFNLYDRADAQPRFLSASLARDLWLAQPWTRE